MSVINRIKVWGSELLKSADLNGEFNNVVNVLNNLDAATSTWTNVKATTISPQGNIAMGGNKLTGLGAGSATGDSVRYEQLFNSNYWAFRRPVLQYASATVVNMETGLTGTSGQVAILFPDGTYRTDSTTGRINCNLAQNSALTGIAQSGLDTGSVSNTKWYSFYAVKSQVNTTDIVHVASLNSPIQANFSTLNSNFGANSWVYLGTLPYSDNVASTGIPKFIQAGNRVTFYNTFTDIASATSRGIRLTSTGGATSLTYNYASGNTLSSSQIPAHLLIGNMAVVVGSSTVMVINDSAVNFIFVQFGGLSGYGRTEVCDIPFTQGLKSVPSGSTTQEIDITAYTDGVLGIGSPML